MGTYTLYHLISAALKSPWIASPIVVLGILLLINEYHAPLKRLAKKTARQIGDGLFWTMLGMLYVLGFIHEWCWLKPKAFFREVKYWWNMLRQDPIPEENEYDFFDPHKQQLP